MTLLTDLHSVRKEWRFTAFIDGAWRQLVDLPSFRRGYDQERSGATIPQRYLPDYTRRVGGSLIVTLNGTEYPVFNGWTDPMSAQVPNIARTVDLIDELGLLRKGAPADITWSNVSFPTAVTAILTAAGVSRIGPIYDPGYMIGASQAIVIKAGEPLQQVLNDLMEFGGTKIICDPSGWTRVDDVSGIPTESTAAWAYAHGASGATELGFYSSKVIIGGSEDLTSKVVISGPSLANGTTPTAERNAPSTVGTGDTYSRSLRFVQDATVAGAIATRELSRRARRTVNLAFSAPFNPGLQPGQTILFRDATIGYLSNTPALVWSISMTGIDMTVTLKVGYSLIDGFTTQQSPVAAFDLIIEYQPIIVAGSAVRYVVQCADVSYDLDGQVVIRAWSTSGVTAGTDATSSEASPCFVYDSLGGKTITLTVTDNEGLISTVTRALDGVTAPTHVTRQLSLAEGATGWTVLRDGENFETFTNGGASCTAVPPFNESYLLAGWSDGDLTTLSNTTLTTVATLPAGIDSLFTNEYDATNVLIGVGAKLYRSFTSGASPVLVKDFGSGTIYDAQSSPANVYELRVCIDRYVRLDYGAGTWDATITGAVGTVARMFASAGWGHACVFSGGAAASDALKFEEGSTVDWTAVASPPTSLYTVTAMRTTQGFVVGDDDGKLYSILKSGSTYIATDIAQIAAGGIISDGIRDGALDGLMFFTTTNATTGANDGLWKLFNLTTALQVRQEAASQVGYGALGPAVTQTTNGRLILLPSGATGGSAADKLFVYDPATSTWGSVTPPVNGWYWISLDISPFDRDTWLLLGNSLNTYRFDVASGVFVGQGTSTPVLYRTTTAGSSWTAIPLPHPYTTTFLTGGAGNATTANCLRTVWSDVTDNAWGAIGFSDGSAGIGATTYAWRGNLTTASLQGTYTTGEITLGALAGLTDDLIGYVSFGGPERLIYYTDGGTTPTNPGTGTITIPVLPWLERGPGTSRRVVVAASDSALYATGDYRAAQPSLRSAGAGGTSIAALTDGTWYLGGANGVAQITDLFGTPSASVVAASGVSVGRIRRDPTRTLLAVRKLGTKDVYTYNGATWSLITGPTAAIAVNLMDDVGVVV